MAVKILSKWVEVALADNGFIAIIAVPTVPLISTKALILKAIRVRPLNDLLYAVIFKPAEMDL